MSLKIKMAVTAGVFAVLLAGWGWGGGSKAGGSFTEIAKERGLSPQDMEAAVRTYTPSGKHDPYIMFASGGHNGGVLVIGVPSMRILKSIPVFSLDSWQGWGYGSKESLDILAEGNRPGHKLSWGDVHHPALSETHGMYDGQFLFVNDKANARVAVIDLRDFSTKQIVVNPFFYNDHGGTFVTPDTDYVLETSQYNVPYGGKYEPLKDFKKEYKGVATFWRFDRKKGRIDPKKSFSVELPPYWQDIADLGKGPSDGYAFINSLNTEQVTGGNLNGKPNIEVGASKNDMDFLHVFNWRKAAQLVASGKAKKMFGMGFIPLDVSLKEGLLYLIAEPKSPHGVDVTPKGDYIVISGKLDPHVTIYSFANIENAIKSQSYDGKDSYGVPILKYDSVMVKQVEVGLGPLHTQFDGNGNAYTSLFLDSAIAKWTLGPPYHTGADAWRLVDKVPVQYNVGHLSCIQGDTTEPGTGYCISMNKWAIDRFAGVGPLLPQNFQLISTDGEKMHVVYDLPIGNAEPHYAQIVKADILKPILTYPLGTDPATMAQSPFFTPGGAEKIVRHGREVEVFMTEIRSHITPDNIEVNQGDHVVIHITNIEAVRDATHGFAISDYNISMSMEPGKTDTVEFTADKSGVFPFYCTEFCSALHLEMAGYLVVKGK